MSGRMSAAWAVVAVVVGTAEAARAFTLAETGAAMGTASALSASQGMSSARTLGTVRGKLAGVKVGAGLDQVREEDGRGFGGPCGRGASRGPSKSWKRTSDAGTRSRATTAWKTPATATRQTTRVAWAKASDPSRCR